MNANPTFKTSIGKKYEIHPPKAIVKALDLKEGEKVLLRISGDALILSPLHDPIQLASPAGNLRP
ncbi:TPA: AbrB/MazE/SpoVT family DNA-binding domain-containing protein [Candidatus Bathyarchaeota archaeon]|nr:AbrB/MazE/SpoVT family DNA-binding domain-containing protein [Candidatus Bathyarchaeota archaeon]